MNPIRDITNGILMVVNIVAGCMNIVAHNYWVAAFNLFVAALIGMIWIATVYKESESQVREALDSVEKMKKM
jgi:hypothetical protein